MPPPPIPKRPSKKAIEAAFRTLEAARSALTDAELDAILDPIYAEQKEEEEQKAPEQPYLREIRRRESIEGAVNTTSYVIEMPDRKLDEMSPQDVFEVVDGMIRGYIRDQGLNPRDKVRVVLASPTGESFHHISSAMMKVEDFDLTAFMERVTRVLQSGEELELNTLRFEFLSVVMPAGSAWLAAYNESDLYRKKCVVRVRNSDELCGARAVVTGKARLDHDKRYDDMKRGRRAQTDAARQLHAATGVPEGPVGLEEFQLWADHLKIQIVLVAPSGKTVFATEAAETPPQVFLLKFPTRNHYDLVTSMQAFTLKKQWCRHCCTGYQNNHACLKLAKCKGCGEHQAAGACYDAAEKEWTDCGQCLRRFPTAECHAAHIANATCEKKWKCRDCHKTFKTGGKKAGEPHLNGCRQTHVCGHDYCTNCGSYVETETHKCFMQKVCLPAEHSSNIVYFDFEAQQETGEHVINLSVSEYADGGPQIVHHTIQEFVEWALGKKHMEGGYKFVAHNGKGYDFQFVLAELLGRGLEPHTIYMGSKLMRMSLGRGKKQIVFIDSLNFLTMPLKDFPKTFGLQELKKGHFPHFFNTVRNACYTGPLPAKKHYGYNQMKTEDRKKFLQWHEAEQKAGTTFDMQRDILSYCRSDVDILKKGCEAFRRIFIEHEGIDPFNQATIASTCMKLYRSNYMPEDHIAVLPEVRAPENHSRVSIEWLTWQAAQDGVTIQHALSGGEYRIGYKTFAPDEAGPDAARDGTRGNWVTAHYKADGFCQDTRTVYEFHGCFWHGCPDCYENGSTVNCQNGKTMRDLRKATEKRGDKLRRLGYTVVEMRECAWRKRKAQDRDLSRQVAEFGAKVIEPLNPREAMFGGRVNAVKLKWESKGAERAHYVDITSLYPTVNYQDSYPKGHPQRISSPTTASLVQGEYFGMAKCRVLPPRRLYHPLLPQKIRDPAGKYEKLMFPLCWTCAATECAACTHTEDQRAMIGTWTTVEILKAVELGYRVLDTYDVWHWPETSTDLFRGYVARFLKIKQEASGWPEWVLKSGGDSTGKSVEAAKRKYIDDYEAKQGIRLDYDRVSTNEGLRAMSKLCLNSLWGKFGQNPVKSQTLFIKSQEQLYKLLTNDKLEEVDLNIINGDIVEATYREKRNHIPDQVSTNIAVAVFTTSHARLRLYEQLEVLGEQVLYYDTDSIVYFADPEKVATHQHKTVQLGDLLGDWTDELKGKTITNWVSGGPKNYGYRLDDGSLKCKIKGFSLHHENSQTLNLGNMLGVILRGLAQGGHIVTSPAFTDGHTALTEGLDDEGQRIATRVARHGRAVVWNERQITREKKTKTVQSRQQERIYGFTYTKRHIRLEHETGVIDTRPYGWCEKL